MSLPFPLLHHLATVSTEQRAPAYLKVTAEGNLLEWGGHLERYGLAQLQKGEFIGDRLFYLASYFPFAQASEVITAIQVEDSTLDVHLVADSIIKASSDINHPIWILLLDITTQAQHQQQQQQQRNDLLLIKERYQSLVQHRGINNDVEPTLNAQIISALEVLALSVQPNGKLELVGAAPAWAEENFDCVRAAIGQSTGAIASSEISPFLENFLIDVESFWQSPSAKCLRSGIWTETSPSGKDLHLEAIALLLASQTTEQPHRIILIESLARLKTEQFDWLQKARQHQLSAISERKENARRLRQAALYDSLTGLPNRALFFTQLNRAFVSRSWRNQKRFGVIVLNLDRFQTINNSLGTEVGDQILIEVANRVRDCLRGHDIPARFSADEFGILIYRINQVREAIAIAERISVALKQPFTISDRKTQLTVSMGIALKEYWYTKPQDLIRDAHIALQQAQTLGQGRYVVFERDMRTNAFELWHLESDLRAFLDNPSSENSQSENSQAVSGLQLHYQPIVDIQTRRVVRFEALLRWRHPQRNHISPARFIPLAEESGLIFGLDRWVLNQVCTDIRDWQQRTGQTAKVNVNISPRHVAEDNLVATVQTATAQANISPESLCIEITERLLLDSTQTAIATLEQLRAMGVAIAIDDFGTGYASLSYLQDLPLDILKIDGYFIQMLKANSTDIVSSIIQLAHRLGFSVTAEQVETMQQYAALQSLGCDTVQGYLFSRPVANRAASSLLNKEMRVSLP